MTPTQTGDKPMVTRELLTCPFCDGEADFGTRPYKNSLWSIHCSGCTAYRVGQTRAEAIAAWNTRAQETLSPEQPLDTIQRLGQEFDAPEASPSLGMGEIGWRSMESAPKDGTRVLVCWDGDEKMSPHVELGKWKHRFGWCNTYGQAFNGDPDRWMALPDPTAAPSPSPDLAEENERLREALGKIEDATRYVPNEYAKEAWNIARATLQSISTANGGPGRDGVS